MEKNAPAGDSATGVTLPVKPAAKGVPAVPATQQGKPAPAPSAAPAKKG
jgi:hypothetical protein